MNKKILSVLILLLVVSFSTTALASLTFTTDAITGTSASGIDLGAGNTLSLNTTNNAPITTGAGLVTLGGNLSVGAVTAFHSAVSTDGTQSFLNVAGTLPAVPTADAKGVSYRVTSAGSENHMPIAASITLLEGYTGSFGTRGLQVYNNAKSTGTNFLSGSGGNVAIQATATGDASNLTSGGSSVGVVGRSQGVWFGGVGIGVGIAGVSQTLGRNIGVFGTASDTTLGTGGAGGQFYLGDGEPELTGPTAALIADNRSIASPIFLARDNASTVFTIADGGAVTSTSNITAIQYKLSALNTVPATSSEACTVGEIRYTATYIYLCSATNTWVRSAFSGF